MVYLLWCCDELLGVFKSMKSLIEWLRSFDGAMAVGDADCRIEPRTVM